MIFMFELGYTWIMNEGEKTEKHPGGRPPKYNKDFHPKLAELLARDGLIDREIATELGICETTITNWKKEHPEFLASIKRGKDSQDDQVESALLKTAKGYEYDAQKPITVSDGTGMGSHVEIVNYKEKVTPNTTAMIFWLKNRRPDKWRDKQEIDVSGTINLVTDSDDKNL